MRALYRKPHCGATGLPAFPRRRHAVDVGGSVAGLLATESAEEVCRQLRQVNEAAHALGCPLPSPFGTLSFLALPVIPELRITAQGLFDVERQQFVRP